MLKKSWFTFSLLIHISSVFSQIPNYVSKDSLVGWWPFSGNANDFSGNGNDGSVKTGANLAMDRFNIANSSYDFNGTSGFIEILQKSNLNFDTTSYTISCWATKTGTSMFHTFIERHYITTYPDAWTDYCLRYENNGVAFFATGQSGTSVNNCIISIPNNTIDYSKWNHYVVSYDSRNKIVKLYLNAKLIGTQLIKSPPVSKKLPSAKLFFGVEQPYATMPSGPVYHEGKLDDIGIWKRVLTPCEIQSLYDTTQYYCSIPSYIPKDSLVGWWPFCGNANDESGFQNHGTVLDANLDKDRFNYTNTAYNFNEVNDKITTSNGKKKLSKNNITVSAWIKLPNQFNNSSLAIVNTGTMYSNGFSLTVDQNNTAYGTNNYQVIFLFGSTNSVKFISNQTEIGNWAHICATYDGQDLKIFLNGLLKDSIRKAITTSYLNNNFIFGEWINVTKPVVKGRVLDDIAVWNRALNINEINGLYSATFACFNKECKSDKDIQINADKDNFCFGDSVTFTAVNMRSYIWNHGVSNGVKFKPNDNTTYTVIGFDSIGCKDTSQILLSYRSLPNLIIASKDRICEGESLTLYATGANKIVWDKGVVNGVSFNPITTETYTVIGTDSFGCTDTGHVSVQVNSLPAVVVNFTNKEICYGEEIILSGSGTDTIIWNKGVENGKPFKPQYSTDYQVTGKDTHGCSITKTVNVLVNSKPELQATIKSPICYNDKNGEVNLSVVGGTSPLKYYQQGTLLSGNKLMNMIWGNYEFETIDVNGCKDTIQVTLVNPPKITANINTTGYTIINQIAYAEVEMFPVGNYSYQWYPSENFQTPNKEGSNFSLTENGEIIVNVINENGCEQKDTAEIIVIGDIERLMPNAFTPNEDSLNDIFKPSELFEIVQLAVYDNWGQRIYSEQNINKGWDGNFNNEKVMPGTYSYFVTLKLIPANQQFNISGKVNVLY